MGKEMKLNNMSTYGSSNTDWSDHGVHLGEKDHIEKFALWEKANHIPFIIAAPREKKTHGKISSQPIPNLSERKK